MNVEVTQTDQPTVTITAAKKLDRQICNALDGMETYSLEVFEGLSQMRETLAYKHLGFKTWAEYMQDRTSAYTHLKVTRAQLVWTLWDDGHSDRDIAEKLGVTHTTVRRDREKRKVEHNVPPASKGRDGKSYPRQKSTPTVDPATRVRPRTKTEEIAFCGDGWNQSYKIITSWITNMASRNPTYAQLEQFEGLLRRTLVKVGKMKETIEKAK